MIGLRWLPKDVVRDGPQPQVIRWNSVRIGSRMECCYGPELSPSDQVQELQHFET
jgi:hypothetical protein